MGTVDRKKLKEWYEYAEAAFTVDYSQRTGTFNMLANHMHDTYEVYYLFSGQRKYFISDRTYLIQKGDFVFIPKHELHRTLDAGTLNHERIVLNFHDHVLDPFTETIETIDMFSPFKQGSPTLRLHVEDRHIAESILYKMILEMKDRAPGYSIYLRALLVELMLFLARCVEKYETSVTPFDSPLHQKIAEIANYIQHNYMKPLSLSYLSKQFYISSYYLSRVFKEVTGFSFIDYLNHIRIKEAQRLLRESDGKVLSISECVGFESIAHFGRVFKRTVNLSPTQYRRMHQRGILRTKEMEW